MTFLLIICAWFLLLAFVTGLCVAAGAGDRAQARRRLPREHEAGGWQAGAPAAIPARGARPARTAQRRVERAGSVAA